MADENKPAFYPRVGNIKAKNFKPAKPMPFIDDPRAMELPRFGEDSDQFGMVDVGVPSQQNLELGRRMVERENQLRRQREADRSPLEKAAGALQTVRLMGSALTQAINSLPTRMVHGDAAAEKFIEDRMYKPEQPLAYEYAGDVGDFLEKLETQYKIPPILPEAVALQYLTGPATSQAMRTAGRGAEKAGRAIERRMEPVVKGALERGGLPREMVLAMGANTQSNVVKPKGGNWLAGSVEKVLDPLITKGVIANKEIPYGPEFDAAIIQRIADLKDTANLPGYKGGAGRVAKLLEDDLQDAVSNQDRAKNAAINKWVQSNLTNYVKKDMATPDDPVRKLADEGISHLPEDRRPPLNMGAVRETRKEAGFPDPYGQSPQGLLYESLADKPIGFGTVGEMINRGKGEPWMEKVDPFTRVHGISPMDSVNFTQDIGFNHILDVLREDLAAGRIRPEQLNKVSMEQAVRRTHEYDQELAAKMNAARTTAREGLPVYKDYPEGYRWVQLTRPGDFAAESDAMGHSVRGYEPPKGHPDWTEGSGDSGSSSYGLGGWDAIKKGEAKVYSLVDAKGEPHATIEVGKGRHPIGSTGRGNNFPDELRYGDYDNNYLEIPKEKQLEIYELGKKLFYENPNAYAENRILSGDRTPDIHDSFQKAADMLLGEKPGYVRQIKGKGNARPISKYDPYTQDFVKSGGWSDVKDLQNTGLQRVEEGETPPGFAEWMRLRSLGTELKIPAGYYTPEELVKFGEESGLKEKFPTVHGGWRKNLGLDPEMPLEPPVPPDLEGMKRGGVVISSNPDTMMLELNNQKMAGGGAIAKLARAAPKSKAEIDAIARRMAPQMLGEFVRGRTGSQSVAEKTQKQFAREKEMVHDIRPTGAERGLPRTVDYEELKDNVMVGIAGDPTISGKTIYSVNGVPLESPSPQHGGPLYGLEHEGDAFWASGLNAANRVQNVAREASKQYDLPVLGNYVMMGPDSINYAQHYADANLAAINPAKMSRGQIEDFNKLVRLGSKKSGPRPSFPGIENPSEAYLHFSIDPELRKHFNALMQMPTVTQKYNLPSGVDIRHAVTEPDLRDLEIGVTGKSIGRLRPEIEDLGYSEHPTYSHDIPGEFLGSTKYNIPYELSFPDTLKSVRENPKQAPQEFGSFKYVGPRQVIDQQLIDEIKQYQEMIKKYTGKKKGGGVKQPAAYIDGNEFVEAAQKYGIRDSMNNLNMIVNLVNKGLTVDDAARQVADSGMHKAEGGEVSGDDLIIEERPL